MSELTEEQRIAIRRTELKAKYTKEDLLQWINDQEEDWAYGDSNSVAEFAMDILFNGYRSKPYNDMTFDELIPHAEDALSQGWGPEEMREIYE